MRALIVDDDPLLADQLSQAMTQAGFVTDHAADGTQGVYLKLDNHGTGLLQQHSMERRGRTLIVLLNGRQVSNLLVDRPVTDGIVSIPRGLSAEDITLLTTVFPVLGESGKKR